MGPVKSLNEDPEERMNRVLSRESKVGHRSTLSGVYGVWFRVLGSRANGQKRICEMSLVQKVALMKSWGQDLGAERAALGL